MGHEPSLRGIFTAMLKNRKPRVDPEHQETMDAFLPMNALADVIGWPEQWIVCPHCGAQAWRLPPHLFDPCPLIVEAAEAQGLKTDAERQTAIRMGVGLEEQQRAMKAFLQQFESEDGDDDDQ